MALGAEHTGWLRLVEAHARVGLSVSMLRKLAQRGTVPAIKDGVEWRMDPRGLAQYVATRQGKPGRRKRKGPA